MVKEIELQNGMIAFVDDDDFEKVKKFKCHARASGKKGLIVYFTEGERNIPLNRFLMGVKEDEFILFKDGNSFNLQKNNMYISSKRGLVLSRRGKFNSTSKYKGVHWDKSKNKWKASISLKGKTKNLGVYTNEDDAARAFNKAALEFIGDKCFLNTIGKDNNASVLNLERSKQTRMQNALGFKGVYKRGQKYISQISISGKQNYLGIFKDLESAAKAYDKKAYELHGDKAMLNFPEDYKNKNENG